eukprot:scaffold24325_cov45-Phaeocystis_antarctica.AAC.1
MPRQAAIDSRARSDTETYCLVPVPTPILLSTEQSQQKNPQSNEGAGTGRSAQPCLRNIYWATTSAAHRWHHLRCGVPK